MKVGKLVRGHLYLHVSALGGDHLKWVNQAAELAGNPSFTVARIRMENGREIALLNYPHFFTEPFPALAQSRLVNLLRRTIKATTYRNNPPILHRKELLLKPDHPAQEAFQAITRKAEEAGLFLSGPARSLIGRQDTWAELLAEAGLSDLGVDSALNGVRLEG